MTDPAGGPVPDWRSADWRSADWRSADWRSADWRSADLGSFFAVTTYRAGSGPGPGWRPLAELWSDERLLLARVASVRAALAADRGMPPETIALRVAGSVFQLDLLARLLSPALSLAVSTGQLLEAAGTFWQPGAGSTVRLAVPEPSGSAGSPDQLAGRVLAGPVAELIAAMRQACSLSTRVGWGNAASALNGAAIVLGALRPASAGRTGRLTAAVLAMPPLRLADPDVGGRFRRDSCCLLYRISPAGRASVCGDCVLLARG